MGKTNPKVIARFKRKLRHRDRLLRGGRQYMVSVYRSLKHIYAHVRDIYSKKIVCSSVTSSKSFQEAAKNVKGKVGKSRLLGNILAEKMKGLGISEVVFDKSGYRYHGRVKALVDGIKDGGIKV